MSGWLRRVSEELSFIRGNVLILLVSWAMLYLGWYASFTYFSLYVLELGGTPFTVGLVNAAHCLAYASVQFLGGYIADSYGRRKIIVTMTFALACSYLMFVLAPTWKILLVGAVVEGVSLIYTPAIYAMLADSLPPEKRGLGYSLTILATASSVAAPFLASAFVSRMGVLKGMRLLYAVLVTMCLAAALLRMGLRETFSGRRSVNPLQALKAYPDAVRESFRVWSSVPKEALWLSVVYVTSYSLTWLCSPYYVIYATEELGVSEELWAVLMSVNLVFLYLPSIPVGKLVDVVGRVKPLVASMAFMMVSSVMFILGGIPLLASSLALSGMASTLFATAYQSLQTDLVPAECRGRVIGFTEFFTYIFTAFGGLFGGYLYQNVSPKLPFITLALAQVPLIAIASTTLRRVEDTRGD